MMIFLLAQTFSFEKRKSVMEERFDRIEQEIGVIKAKLGMI